MSYDDNPFEEGSAKNPFDDDASSSPSFKPSSTQRNSTLRTSPPPAPKQDKVYSNSTINPQVNTSFNTSKDGIKAKEEELKRREEDIKRREKTLQKQEETVARGGKKPKNWPFFRPILYQNIAEEIPVDEQMLVRFAYYIWLATVTMFLFNIATVLGDLIVTGDGKEIASFILSIVYTLFLVPLFFMGFRILYNAARKTKSSYYLSYLCFKWFEFVVIVWQTIGVRGWGGGGFLVMIYLFEGKGKSYKAMAIIALCCTVFWIFVLLLHVYLFFHARKFYKLAGGYREARKQGATYGARKAAENPDLVTAAAKGTYSASQHVV